MNLTKYIFIHSPTIHQPNYQKIIKCFQSFLPLNVIDNILNEDISLEELDDVIEVIVNDEDFVSSEIEIEFYDNINEMKDAKNMILIKTMLLFSMIRVKIN